MVSGTRAEFGLLKNVIAGIEASNSLQLEFVVTGSHLSPEFGMTGDEIGESGLPVSRRVEMLLSSDSSIGMAKSFGLGSLGFADVFDDIQPDLLLVLGDRYEVLLQLQQRFCAAFQLHTYMEVKSPKERSMTLSDTRSLKCLAYILWHQKVVTRGCFNLVKTPIIFSSPVVLASTLSRIWI